MINEGIMDDEMLVKSIDPHTRWNPLVNLANPAWADARKVHDWRNHVPDTVKKVWPLLCRTARATAYVMAESRAEDEEWD